MKPWLTLHGREPDWARTEIVPIPENNLASAPIYFDLIPWIALKPSMSTNRLIVEHQ